MLEKQTNKQTTTWGKPNSIFYYYYEYKQKVVMNCFPLIEGIYLSIYFTGVSIEIEVLD